MSSNSTANYGGRQPNNTAYVKYFIPGSPSILWTTSKYKYNGSNEKVITTADNNYDNLYIPGNLFVDGSIVSPSDITLKENIVEISEDLSDNIMSLKPIQYTFKSDIKKDKQIHYGFIAQDFEAFFPELVSIKPDKKENIKAINYLEILPLLVGKIQKMQNEIDELKNQLQGQQVPERQQRQNSTNSKE
jgi:hypothetical protein